MTVPATLRGSSRASGLRAAAQLLRAAGPGADLILAQLTPGETRAIHDQMDHLSAEQIEGDRSALEAFLLETAEADDGSSRGAPGGIWGRLTKAHAPLLAALASRESPQVAAWLIGKLEPRLAAHVVRMLSDEVSLGILRRILNAKAPPEAVCQLIESTLEKTLARLGPAPQLDGHAKLARIFDQLDHDTGLLSQLDKSTPGAAERVRALMFTFDDLAALDAAGLQTLIAGLPRETLVRALKGAPAGLTNAFYSNLTRRAGALIREEMEALGPIRAADVQEARASVLDLARKLIQSGDIMLGTQRDEDELVE